ncbi:cupin domain-containing protein [Roseibium sp.]|uniref:cupin domain-containing protein n=1 Tax=Roseibium sp. TaxID=1936156 RepID=UPI003511A669
MAMEHPIRFTEKLARLEGLWSPRVVAEMNDYQFKIVRIQGDFVWHDHPETDETFIVLKGEIRIDFRDRAVVLGEGEMYVVPKGVEHKPYADSEAELLLIEPKGILNTGHAGGDRTQENDLWI